MQVVFELSKSVCSSFVHERFAGCNQTEWCIWGLADGGGGGVKLGMGWGPAASETYVAVAPMCDDLFRTSSGGGGSLSPTPTPLYTLVPTFSMCQLPTVVGDFHFKDACQKNVYILKIQ